MAELLGHFGMGLLFAFPAWILWDGRTAAAFAAFVALAAQLPDLDLVLQALGFPVKHHGAFHTVVFVVGFAVVAGAIAVVSLRPVLRRWWHLSEHEAVHSGTLYLFVTGGFVLGGLSHLFADMLASDWAEPIEPLWPFVQESYPIHVIPYDSPWLNLGLLFVAAALHLSVIVSKEFPIEHRYRTWKRALSSE